MARHVVVSARCSFVLFGACVCFASSADALPVIWTGPSTTFSKIGTDDPTLAANQDRLSPNVWLTRGSSEGMFNIAPGHELNYVRFTSPADTQWATDVMIANVGKNITATNWQNLTFTDWAPAYGGPGFALAGNITTHNAVMHLVTDDIYLNLLFTQFNSSGDFTYARSSPAAPSPTGDYNGNHVIDAADYVVWRNTLNQPASPFGSGADGNANGTIDAGDYNFWRANFGNNVVGLGSVAATAVPEPSTVSGGLLTLLSLRRLRSRNRRLLFQFSA
jgi:Dockerin type I domain